MATGRSGGGRPKGPKVGAILTGTVVGQAKRGVLIELGSSELLLPRTRYGAASDQIEAAGYGDPLTVEVVDESGAPGGIGLSRVGIERSLRQPRPMDAQLVRAEAGLQLVPADDAPPFEVTVVDRVDLDALVGTTTRWLVGAPYRSRRFALLDGHGSSLA